MLLRQVGAVLLLGVLCYSPNLTAQDVDPISGGLDFLTKNNWRQYELPHDCCPSLSSPDWSTPAG
jgi:hypothetical protein